ncbi:MAG: hypothetical protein AAGB24_05535 [Bacteroidota bacterium]
MGKLEKHIKERLRKREIKPSEQAWQRIETDLGQTVVNSKRTPWYAIVAGFIGIVLFSSIYLGLRKTVFTETNDRSVNKKIVGDKVTKTKNKPPIEKTPLSNETKKALLLPSQEPVAVDLGQIENKSATMAVENIDDALRLPNDPIQAKELLIEEKVVEVLAQVTLLETQNTTVTEGEIDSLLRAAQRELLTIKVFQENRKVDAMALLTAVEDELDQTFRDQLFETLKEGYFKLKTAVADRNN